MRSVCNILIMLTALLLPTVAQNRPPTMMAGGDGMDRVWQSGDVACAFTTSGTPIILRVASVASDSHDATLTANGWALAQNTQYYAGMPYQQEWITKAPPVTALPFTLLGQTQASNDNADHLRAYDYMWAGALSDDSKVDFRFKHYFSVVRLACKMPRRATLKSLTMYSSNKQFVTSGTLSIKTGSTTTITLSRGMPLTLDNVTVENGDSLITYMMLAPGDYSSSTLSLDIISTDGKAFGTSFKGCPIQAGHYYPVSLRLSEYVMDSAPAVFDTALEASSPAVSSSSPARVGSVKNIYGHLADFVTDYSLTPLRGDVNGDKGVDVVDAVSLMGKYINNDTFWLDHYICDMNEDGVIDVLDAIMIISKYLNNK